MDEIKADISDYSPADIVLLQNIINRSLSNGAQIGISWTENVYNYIFESDCNFDLSALLNMDIEVTEIPQDNIL